MTRDPGAGQCVPRGDGGRMAGDSRDGRVLVTELTEIGEFEDVQRLFDGIWNPDPANPPITVEMMRALSHAGNYVAGAYDGGTLVGASVGFLGAPAGKVLHSHVTGALAGRGIGFALKLHQRDWALERGLERITWTYDPLVRRNAHFNLAKLGARPEEYLPSFYGAMSDAINAGDESDRVLAVWRLTAPHVLAAVRGEPHRPVIPADAVAWLGERDGGPVRGPVDAAGAAGPGTVLVAVPRDVEALRRADPRAAGAWRLAVREVLGGLLEEGGRVTGFDRETGYVVRRRPEDGPRPEGEPRRRDTETPYDDAPRRAPGTPYAHSTPHNTGTPHADSTPHDIGTPHDNDTPHNIGTPRGDGTSHGPETPRGGDVLRRNPENPYKTEISYKSTTQYNGDIPHDHGGRRDGARRDGSSYGGGKRDA
ncbi:hypothetical protein [Streptosporangium sp. NPDC002524]|uniref:hypothetical protein n=1 Tax=Streptosporangium sp. NPDC002524 TaxID=3154537 RepID=UPI00331C5998